MIDGQIEAVRRVREEADRLRLECVRAAKTRALLHVAFDRDLSIPLDHSILLSALGGIQ